MKSFSDPECLRKRRGIAFEKERIVCERDEFDYFASLSGLAAVGVTNKRGAVLLMDSTHGWRLPYGPVDPGKDWLTAGSQMSETLTGVEVSVTSVERVSKLIRRLEGSEELSTVSYDVVLRLTPVTGEPIADDPSFGPWDEVELGWFDTIPEDAYWDHESAVDDIHSISG
ncbi:hypothetical protein [Halocatena marina]|uniref:hypothetical protein n=1 Tax=Halocatena marina TaxID=2934937 RepID=UPI00200F880B|nr:hypothetical protein [Halocatena marina]